MQSTPTAPRIVTERWVHPTDGSLVEVHAPGHWTPDSGWTVVGVDSTGVTRCERDHGRDPVAAFGHAYRLTTGPTTWLNEVETVQEPVACACGSTTEVHAACPW